MKKTELAEFKREYESAVRDVDKIINKFGCIPAILYQLKKLDCRKYANKDIIKNTIITNVLFIRSPFSRTLL